MDCFEIFWFIVSVVSLALNAVLFERTRIAEDALTDLQMYVLFREAFLIPKQLTDEELTRQTIDAQRDVEEE